MIILRKLKKEGLPHAGIEPATFRLLGGRSATKPMRLCPEPPAAVLKSRNQCNRFPKDQRKIANTIRNDQAKAMFHKKQPTKLRLTEEQPHSLGNKEVGFMERQKMRSTKLRTIKLKNNL